MINLPDYMERVESVKLRVINEDHYTDGDKIVVHLFERNWIKQVVTEDIKKGNYRIGVIVDGSFNVCYIGRATDQALQERLLQHTEYLDDVYYFDFNAAKTDDEAIKQECIDFHSFGGNEEWLDNEYHPSLPKGDECPWEGCDHVGQ